MFRGSVTALATPFTSRGIDAGAFTALVEWQVREGTDGLLPCGTTGEGPVLTATERDRLIRLCVEGASRRVPVIAAAGTSCTATTIEQVRAAEAAGADGALVVTPCYNAPTQEGLYRHFAAIANAVDLPILLHNVPARTGVDLHVSTIERLARIPAIVGIVDATGDPDRPRATALAVGRRFVQMSGCDANAVSFALAGGRGCVSTVANVAPALCAALQGACRRKAWGEARAIEDRLRPLVTALAREPDPGPVKQALFLLRPGFDRSPRAPLLPASVGTACDIEDALRHVSDDAGAIPLGYAMFKTRVRPAPDARHS